MKHQKTWTLVACVVGLVAFIVGISVWQDQALKKIRERKEQIAELERIEAGIRSLLEQRPAKDANKP